MTAHGSAKSRDRRQNLARRAAVSAAVTVACLAVAQATGWGAAGRLWLDRLLLPLVRLTVLIAAGLAAGQLVETMGWTARLGAVFSPLLRLGRLPAACAAAFTTAFFSGTAANAMLLEFHRSGTIDRRQLILGNLVNQVPAFFLHLPTTMLIVLPLTGGAGLLYFALTFGALLLRFAAFLAAGRLLLPAPSTTPAPAARAASPRPRPALRSFVPRLGRRLAAVMIYVVPVYCLVFVAAAADLFTLARTWLASVLTTRLIPVEALSLVIVGFAAEFTTGFATAGALMNAGVLGIKQAALALVAGNVIAFPIRALRHQLPRLVGIFAPRLGLTILLLGQSTRVASLLLVAGLYALWG